MLLSIEAQLCTRRKCKTFQPRRPLSLAMHKVRVRRCPIYNVSHALCAESMSAARMSLYSIVFYWEKCSIDVTIYYLYYKFTGVCVSVCLDVRSGYVYIHVAPIHEVQ